MASAHSPQLDVSDVEELDPAVATQLVNMLRKNIAPSILADLVNKTPSQNKKRGRHIRDGSENQVSSTLNSGDYEYGRMYLRQGDLFESIDTVVTFAIKHAVRDSEDETPLLSQHKRLLKNWGILCKMMPGFRDRMIDLADQRKERKAICREISSGMNKARADDANSLKTSILNYVLPAAPNASLNPPLSSAASKTCRGFNHPIPAKLLCPIKYPATPETYVKILSGQLAVTATMLPRFLFPDDQVYNPEDVPAGILRGHLLPRASRHIFQGPSMALEAPGTHRGNSGNAAIANLTEMTPCMVAYVAVQVRFALSSTTSWAKNDGPFDYSDFFSSIVGLFDDPEDLKSHLQHFNFEVFGTKAGLAAQATLVVDDTDDFEVVRWQRAQKRVRLEKEAAAGGAMTAGEAAVSDGTMAAGETGDEAAAAGVLGVRIDSS